MTRTTTRSATCKPQTTSATVGPIVSIARGTDKETLEVVWLEGDTVASVLERAHVRLSHGLTAVLARRRVQNPAEANIRPGERILIAGKPGHG